MLSILRAAFLRLHKRPKTVRRARRLTPSRPGLERLDDRVLPAAPASIVPGGVLLIQGGNTAENVAVSARRGPAGGWQLVVSYNNGTAMTKVFNAAAVARIVYNGNGGDDRFVNNTGIACTLRGGAGRDALFGGGGADQLEGGAGDDVLDGRGGNDRIFGGLGDDLCLGAAGADLLMGGGDDDYLDGGAGNDNCLGEDGDDNLNGGAGADRLTCGNGDDQADGDEGDDIVTGGAGDDDLNGSTGDDDIHGGAGNDLIDGDEGDDDLHGDADDDEVQGGAGDDDCDGGEGEDEVSGGLGDDTEVGGEMDGPEAAFAALLSGPNGARAEVEYEIETEDGVTQAILSIEIEHAPANSSFEVVIGGAVVGTVQTGQFGCGKLVISDPALLPAIDAGTTISIGSLLQGSFTKNEADVDECHDELPIT